MTTKTTKRRNTVSIEILDQEFKIATDGTSDRAKMIAKILDTEIKNVLKKSANSTQLKALLLAALNITDKYITLQERHNRFKLDMSSQTQDVLKLLENVSVVQQSQ